MKQYLNQDEQSDQVIAQETPNKGLDSYDEITEVQRNPDSYQASPDFDSSAKKSFQKTPEQIKNRTAQNARLQNSGKF